LYGCLKNIIWYNYRMQNNKNLLIGAIVALVIIAGVLFWVMQRSTLPTDGNNPGEVAELSEDTSAPSVHAAGGTINYAGALSQYAGAILVLDAECKAAPAKMTFRQGGELMLVNNSPSDRVVKAGSVMNLKARSFKIIQVDSAAGSPLWNVDCDQSKNVATISIQ
jgi:hypothetical protein